MFGFFRKQKKVDYIEQVIAYIERVYTEPTVKETGGVKYSVRETHLDDGKKYSVRMTDEPKESYNFEAVSSAMDQYFKTGEAKSLMAELEKAKEKTFMEMLIWRIAKSGKKDSAVYNAAQIDRRLFSKIMSDRDYKPSKDTAVALIFALHLTLEQAEDLLKRAGYSLSHSSKRDIIFEYFLREGVSDLMIINEVLCELGEKKIGR